MENRLSMETKGKNSFVYHSKYGEDIQVKLEISSYLSNGRLSVSLMEIKKGRKQEYGSLTVNLDTPAPDYCGYLDTNNLGNVEKFVTDNDLGEFTGLVGRSGYCEYPLYLFHVEKLRELCPEQMAAYEQRIDGTDKEQEQQKVR